EFVARGCGEGFGGGAGEAERASVLIFARSGLKMNELIFLVEGAPEGGFTARALGQAIFTEADDLPSLREQIRDAVSCRFEAGQELALIRLHFVCGEVMEM